MGRPCGAAHHGNPQSDGTARRVAAVSNTVPWLITSADVLDQFLPTIARVALMFGDVRHIFANVPPVDLIDAIVWAVVTNQSSCELTVASR